MIKVHCPNPECPASGIIRADASEKVRELITIEHGDPPLFAHEDAADRS
ncbi:MAG: hypothetical protein JO284_02365 [Planctomycetaceae bacterium]|nr:hypothetical protein [Planctomycetaceae bacterium]MBV8605933.1 hypothetical protein [Singulisphaera sp.]MBV8269991.1 hypothetical protein [Planctomycetaceae bacterium]MBV8315375.1 hypothetical protein [Planctomycetaceae bacterium]MBV8384090.1 hypothetical protein [Planctomycetaceae bacterium]